MGFFAHNCKKYFKKLDHMCHCGSQREQNLKMEWKLIIFFSPLLSYMEWFSDSFQFFLNNKVMHSLTENQGLRTSHWRVTGFKTRYHRKFVKCAVIFKDLNTTSRKWKKFSHLWYMTFSLLIFKKWKMKMLLVHFGYKKC